MAVVIIGAGGFGREVVNVLTGLWGSDNLLGFIDDGDVDDAALERLGAPFLGTVDALAELDASYLIGIGNPATRRSVDDRAARHASPLSAVVDPSATIGGDVHLGPGTIVCPHAALTTNINAGRHLHVNLSATIGHDCTIGDYVTLAPAVNISGNVTVGDGVEFGTAAIVLPGLTIGAGSMVGAGAVATKNVEPGTTVIGVPATPIRH